MPASSLKCQTFTPARLTNFLTFLIRHFRNSTPRFQRFLHEPPIQYRLRQFLACILQVRNLAVRNSLIGKVIYDNPLIYDTQMMILFEACLPLTRFILSLTYLVVSYGKTRSLFLSLFLFQSLAFAVVV